jgi:RsiW-degrading membrane proteinase PrsW (M82 family)
MAQTNDASSQPIAKQIDRAAIILFCLILSAAAALIGAWDLLRFLFGEAWLIYLVPAIAIYIVGFCLPVGLVHGYRQAAGVPSRPFKMAGPVPLAIGALLAIGVGQVFLHGEESVVFWATFILAAALPPLVALAIAAQRLPGITSWRRIMAGIVSGSLLSTHLAVLLTAGVSLVAYALIVPLRDTWAHVISSTKLEHLFYSPALIWTIIAVVVVAPVVEELTKPLGAIILAKRLRSPAEAFLVGMAGGVGFAILENMLYEGSGIEVWGGIAAIRAIGGVLHPLNAGLVAMGWYAVRNGEPGAWRRLAGYYGLAVGAHALWNGGLTVLFAGIGARYFGTQSWTVNIYGLGQPAAVVLFMLIEAAMLWRLLFAVTKGLREEKEARISLKMRFSQPRRLALWGVSSMAVLASVGALYGPLIAAYGHLFLPSG